MSNKGPIDLEQAPGDTPNIAGREISEEESQEEIAEKRKAFKEANAKTEIPLTFESDIPGMAEKLMYVPEGLRERVSKLSRNDIALSGVPSDLEAYRAFLQAEKKVREMNRKKANDEMSYEGVETKSLQTRLEKDDIILVIGC